MAKRTYGQYCGLAVALDVVAERWALLIVRDLAPGPRRFSDLMDGLPGIATDVLADRLRSLQGAGAVEQVAVREPIPGKVYALTDRGRELAAIAGRLAQWGMPLLASVDPGTHRRDPRWALQTMARSYRGGLPDGSYAFTVDGVELHVEVAGERAELRYGPPPVEPLVHLTCTAADFFAMVRSTPRRPRRSHAVGDTALLRDLIAAMPLPVLPDAPRARTARATR